MPKIPQHSVIVEPHPEGYSGPEFLTLIEYGSDTFLTIVDYVTSTSVSAYILDMCESQKMDDLAIVTLVQYNWKNYSTKPISTLFGSLGMAQRMATIHRTFALSDINRVIGRFPVHDLSPSKTVKRRRRREIDGAIIRSTSEEE